MLADSMPSSRDWYLNSNRVDASGWEDKGLGLLAAALSIAIAAILGRRLLIIAGVDISNFF